jgi:hypothetical protein
MFFYESKYKILNLVLDFFGLKVQIYATFFHFIIKFAFQRYNSHAYFIKINDLKFLNLISTRRVSYSKGKNIL